METMKKIVLALMLVGSSLNFADTGNDILEDRIENKLDYQYKTLSDGKNVLKVKDYDVDISEKYINLKIETRYNAKDFDYDKAITPLKELVLSEAQSQKDINIVVEIDKLIGDEKVIYNKTFSQNIPPYQKYN